jgi:DNA-binding NarL/FixJ family response regulator
MIPGAQDRGGGQGIGDTAPGRVWARDTGRIRSLLWIGRAGVHDSARDSWPGTTTTYPSTPASQPSDRCLVVCGNGILRAGLSSIIESQPDLTLLAEACNGAQAVELATRGRPELVLMAVRSLGVDSVEAVHGVEAVDGLDAPRAILRSAPGCGRASPAVIIMTSSRAPDDGDVREFLGAGARGFLLLTSRREELLSAIRAVLDGHTVVHPGAMQRFLSRPIEQDLPLAPVTQAGGAVLEKALRSLSTREREMLLGLARGRSNRELAREFGAREATVKSHVSRLLGKLGVRSRAEAIALVYRNGIV